MSERGRVRKARVDRSGGLLPTSDVQRQSRGQGSYEVDLQHPEEIHASCRLGRREKERGLQEQELRDPSGPRREEDTALSLW